MVELQSLDLVLDVLDFCEGLVFLVSKCIQLLGGVGDVEGGPLFGWLLQLLFDKRIHLLRQSFHLLSLVLNLSHVLCDHGFSFYAGEYFCLRAALSWEGEEVCWAAWAWGLRREMF